MPKTRDDNRDRLLFGDLASGRAHALGELYDTHAPALFRHACALTRQRAEAEDLVQAVFMKLSSTGAELLGVRAPASYLHRMVKTTWLDGQRRSVVGERVVADHATIFPSASPGDPVHTIDVGRALDALPELQREVVVLHVIEGYSFLEIGRMTGVSLFTAAARYRLARARLRQALGERTES
ncbi:MAG: RNA polymerase sigma factor [Acidobacteria bacterium]|jgi:RNA polymerase sigma factor (sigma-70 family)|nr:RNA polymerase sigma factor [Acidobacteriota bacterium]